LYYCSGLFFRTNPIFLKCRNLEIVGKWKYKPKTKRGEKELNRLQIVYLLIYQNAKNSAIAKNIPKIKEKDVNAKIRNALFVILTNVKSSQHI
jgi:hypothetical protein